MTEYSRMAKGSYTVVGGTLGVSAPSAKVINLPFIPDFVQLINYTQAATPANHGIPFAFWDAAIPNTTVVEVNTSGTVLRTDTVTTNGISTFQAGLSLQYGASKQVVAIIKSVSPTNVQVTAHGYSTGDVVIFQGLYQTQYTAGMPQITGIPFTVTRVDADNFTILWDTSGSNYTALSASPSGATVKKVLYPYLYAPGVNIISAITLASTTTITTTSSHNYVVGQEVAFRIPTIFGVSPPAWGTIQLNSLPNNVTPGSPIYGYVVSVTNANTFVVNINSTSYTAFNVNIPVSDVSGLDYAQVLAVGDVNTGGPSITSTSVLYPPLYTVLTGTTRTNSINGPGISGAFFNNTSQGFIIGPGAGVNDTSSWVGGSTGDIMEWRAYLHDINVS